VPPLNYERVYKLKALYPDLKISINGGFKTYA
jgi:tRNA-dihydrouridine synthase A